MSKDIIQKKRVLILLYIIVMIVIISFGIVSIYIYTNSQNKQVNIDMSTLDKKIFEESNFNENRVSDITLDNVTEIFDISKESIIEVVGKTPLLDISSGMYVVIHTNEENVEYVKEKLELYGKDYENKWKTYMQDQYELVKKRKIGNFGNYVYMIVNEMPDDIVAVIKNAK